MSARAQKLLALWNQHVPPETDFADVRLVALYFLGSDVRFSPRGGSHNLIISGGVIADAIRFRNAGDPELSWLNPTYTTVAIPAVSGRRVKAVYVKHLVALVRVRLRTRGQPR